ncbi:MAG: Zn-dependent alcohol dehydrogenase [Myxococcota bacterium]|nr:Zn-dependent alcohol dehydrogenase [Myxococcota bacterium]
MRAALLEAPGSPMKIDEIQIADPGPGQIRVAVKFCGCCHSDLSIAEGTFPAPTPIVLGHEAAGVVDEVGPGVSHLQAGDHVVLTPAPPCGTCYWCVRGEASSCVNSLSIMTNQLSDGQTGLSRQGEIVYRGVGLAAFADYVLTRATGAVKVDPEIPLDVACVVGCAVQTGVGSVLNTAQVVEGATVLVMGLGAIGLSVVQGARLAAAARIIVSDPVGQRREVAGALGATDFIDPTKDDVIERAQSLTGGIGVDYAFECAGRGELISTGFLAARNRGTIVCVGAPPLSDSINLAPASLFVMSEKKLMGTLLGSCNSLREIPRLIALYQAGRLDLDALITARRPLEEINEAMADLSASRGVRTVLSL